MRIVVVCNRFDGYRSDGVYHGSDIAQHLVQAAMVTWTLNQALWASQHIQKNKVMFIKVDGGEFLSSIKTELRDLFVSTESKKAHMLV